MSLTTEAAVLVALRDHFPNGEFAVIPQVPNGTSMRKTRTADALVMGLWESRGIYLHGVEIKVNRNDWAKEKKNPEKAEAIAKYCDFWWIAAGNERVVATAELPVNWGLLAADPRGKLKIVKRAVQLEPAPITRTFLAGLMRAIDKATVPFDQFDAMFKTKLDAAIAERDKWHNSDTQLARANEQLTNLRNGVEAFEKASGIKIDCYSEYFNGEIGKAVNTIRHGADLRVRGQIESLAQMLENMAKQNGELLATLEEHASKVIRPTWDADSKAAEA